MANRPVVSPKKDVLRMKLQTDLDYPEHCHSPLDADHFYDCVEEIDNQQTDHITQPPAPANPLPAEENTFSNTDTVSNTTQSAEEKENSDGQKMGNEHKNVENANDEEELSEVLAKLLQYGKEFRSYARQCGIDADSFHGLTLECTGTEPCLEPFVARSENLEPTSKGDTQCGAEEQNEQNNSSTVSSVFGLPGEEVWCTANSSPRSDTNSETLAPPFDTVHNLRLNNLEEYFRGKTEEDDKKGEIQLPQSSDKQAHRCMKKSKSDSEVQGFTFQKSEDEEGYATESSSGSSSSSDIERQKSSTEWSTLSCHTVSTLSGGSENDDSSNSLDGTQDDYVYQDDDIDDLEGRPDAGGDGGGSHISIHGTEDEGIYEYDEDHVFIIPESGDQDALDSTFAYNVNTVTQNRINVPLRATLTTEQMLDELFPAVRLQPRPVRILQTLPDHPASENTTGGGEGDFELGRRIFVQNFFGEDTSPPQEAAERASWTSPGFDISRDSLNEILCWTTIAGFCASVFLIWQFHSSR